MRASEITRETKETKIYACLNLDGKGEYDIDTGVPFLNHMLELFAKHGFFDLTIKAEGDTEIDFHHTIEDIGIVIGQTIKEALQDKTNIKRYGFFILPMDEALALVAVDLSGRPYLVYSLNNIPEKINNIDTNLFHEFFYALSINAGINLHIDLKRGVDVHHIFEAVFKAFSKALDSASSEDSRLNGKIPSTKGKL